VIYGSTISIPKQFIRHQTGSVNYRKEKFFFNTNRQNEPED